MRTAIRSLSIAIVLAVWTPAQVVRAAGANDLTVLFTGDTLGEVEPCGCGSNPQGGLAKRATYLGRQRAAGPVLLLDAGDALSGVPADRDRARASMILEVMGRLGYDAMAVGERDLVLEVGELKKQAEAAKVTLLAANVVDQRGARPFAEHVMITVGTVKVGVFAVTGGEEFAARGLKVLPPGPAARAAAVALRKSGAKVVIGLLHLPYDAALKLTDGLSRVDYVIQAHDGRLSTTQLVGKTLLTGAGELGRQMGRATIVPGTRQPLFDLADPADARTQLGELEKDIAQARQALRARPSEREELERTIAWQSKRRAPLLKRIEARPAPGQGSAATEFVPLDRRMPEDPEIRRMLEAFRADAARTKNAAEPAGE